MDQLAISAPPETAGSKAAEFSSILDRSTVPSVKGPIHGMSAAEMNVREDGCICSVKSEPNLVLELPSRYRDENYDAQVQKSHGDVYPLESHLESRKGGRRRSVVINWEKRRRTSFDGPSLSISSRDVSVTSMPSLYIQRRNPSSVEKEMPSTTDEDAVAVVMEQHDQFTGSMQSRLAKLQVVIRVWERNGIKGAISAMEKMADLAVLADVISIVTEQMDLVTLEICTCLLPLLSGLLGSNMDRHLSIRLDMLLKLVRTFGSMIYSIVSALTPTGVDIEAEQRFERCNLCFIELEKSKAMLAFSYQKRRIGCKICPGTESSTSRRIITGINSFYAISNFVSVLLWIKFFEIWGDEMPMKASCKSCCDSTAICIGLTMKTEANRVFTLVFMHRLTEYTDLGVTLTRNTFACQFVPYGLQ